MFLILAIGTVIALCALLWRVAIFALPVFVGFSAGFWALFLGAGIGAGLVGLVAGALVGALLWLCAATLLSYTLRSLGELALVYGSFAGLVATLVFLYVSAVTLIFGAEINGVLRRQQRNRGV